MNEFESWLAFRKAESFETIREKCCECRKVIPLTDDLITFDDGDRICEKCADRNEQA